MAAVTGSVDYPRLVFEDNFDKLDLNRWEHEIRNDGCGNWEFQMYHNSRRNSYVRNNCLFIRPTLTADVSGEAAVDGGHVQPVQSARLRTVRSFNFRYGRLEVEAKLPTGDWLWPAIWLLPQHSAYGRWPASGEIDLMESRGNVDLRDTQGNLMGVQSMGQTLHWGTRWNQDAYPLTYATRQAKKGKSLGSAFHRYRMDWGPDIGLRFFLDGKAGLTVNPSECFWELGRNYWRDRCDADNPWLPSKVADATRLAPFDQPFYIILNVAVGGTNGFFPDDWVNRSHPKPWNNNSRNGMQEFYRAKDQWYPTWQGEDAAMQVNYVRVWKLGPD